MFYENRFWNRRPYGIVIIKNHRTLYILEFKRSSDRNEDFLRIKEDEAIEQHKSIIEVLKAAAPEWTFEQNNFVAGRRGAVVEDGSKSSIHREKGQDSVGACATHMRSAWHSNAILLSANTWVVWGWRDDVDGEHWRTSLSANNSQLNLFVISCWRKVKMGQSLSKMSKPTALHTQGTAQVSEWLNISDTAKKLY